MSITPQTHGLSCDLDGKVAVVTGGAVGIGFSISRALAASHAAVCVVATRVEEAEERAVELGGQSSAFSCDVSDAVSVSRVVDQIIARFDKIDILINNAGVSHLAPVTGPPESGPPRM